MLIFLGKLISPVTHVTNYLKSKLLTLGTFTVVLAGECDKALSQSDKTYAKCSLIDYRLNCIAAFKPVGSIPQFRHKERELFRKCRLLEVEAVVKLSGCNIKHGVELGEECCNTFFLIFIAHTLNGKADNIDG